MKNLTFILLCIVNFGVLLSQNNKMNPPLSFADISLKTIPPMLKPPDSLGGASLWGEAQVRILLHWSGSILLSQVMSIEVSRDSSEPKEIYNYSGHPLAFVDTTNKAKSIERYISYIEDIVALTKYQVDYTDKYFQKYNAFWMTYFVQLNPFKTTYDERMK